MNPINPYNDEVSLCFIGHYLVSLVSCAILIGMLIAAISFLKRAERFKGILFFPIRRALAIVALAGWCIYFACTAKWEWIKLSLDAEDPRAAAFVYTHLFSTVGVSDCIRLAMDENQRETVRFYSACHIGEMLARSNDQQHLDAILDQVGDAPLISPLFFGTNAINCELFTPGTTAGPYTVAYLIQEKYHRTRNN